MQDFDLVIYHDKCPDGELSVYLYKCYRESKSITTPCVYLPINAGGFVEMDYSGKTILMMDVSFLKDNLIKVSSVAKSLTILDHHKTAQDNITDPPPNVTVVFDMTVCAAQIVSKYFFPDTDPKWFVEYVGDRDMWTFHNPDTKPFSAFMFKHNMYTYHGFKFLDSLDGDAIKSLLTIGRTYVTETDMEVDRIASQHVMKYIVIGGKKYSVALVKTGIHVSDVGAKLYSTVDCDMAVMYSLKEGIWSFSCRNNKPDVDLSVLLTEFGGGGHPDAAGFKSSDPDAVEKLFVDM